VPISEVAAGILGSDDGEEKRWPIAITFGRASLDTTTFCISRGTGIVVKGSEKEKGSPYLLNKPLRLLKAQTRGPYSTNRVLPYACNSAAYWALWRVRS
jgi:hypothetical protein